MKFTHSIVFSAILALGCCLDAGPVVKKLDRKIDISTQLVKNTYKILLENPSQSDVRQFIFSLTEEEEENYAVFTVKIGGSVMQPSKKEVVDGAYLYKYDLNKPLKNGNTLNVEVELIMTNVLTPYPKSISQGEKQHMEYKGNHYAFSPYSVTLQTTTVIIYSSNLVSYSRLKPSSHSDTTITYGPYENVPPMSKDAMKIHYENNAPFLNVVSMTRLIEVSHWGNIAVEEVLEIRHTGALLKGPFSRYDYQRDTNTYATIKDFKTLLPASAKDVYYRDDIGNISTSNLKVLEESVELEIRPRFPLFGGWKTKYMLGYNIPSYELLYHSGSQYVLKMKFLDHIFDDMVVDDLTVKIILPEGVKNIKLKTPYHVDRRPDQTHYTYLDTFGRTVVIASKKNLIENHIKDFELEYTFHAFLMLQEPFLIFVAFLLMFLIVIVYVRLDFTISKDECVEANMRVSSHCEMVQGAHDKRAALYEKLEDEIQKLKSNKDISHSQLATKKILSAIKDETSKINDLAVKIRVDNADYAEKVTELQKNDKLLQEALQQQLSLVEKLVGGKVNRQNFLDSDATIHKKKEALLEKIMLCLKTI